MSNHSESIDSTIGTFVQIKSELSVKPLVRERIEHKKTIGKLARATHTGELAIGGITIKCSVLENGERVLHQRGMYVALGRYKNPGKKDAADDTPGFLSAKNLQPYIPPELREIWHPVQFESQGGYLGNIAFGYKATILPLVCHVYVDAKADGKLQATQEHIAEQCRILLRGFAMVGITALVDEATGYQEARDRDELQRILEKYISPSFLPWAKRFPDEFYENMFRLWGWSYRPLNVRRPGYVGKLTNQLVYEKLPPGVLDELRRKNPTDETGRRKRKHHQFLTEDIGNPHLGKHLAVVTTLMRISPNKRTFERHFERAFPPPAQQLSLFPDSEEESDE